jgi:hypothetical protein
LALALFLAQHGIEADSVKIAQHDVLPMRANRFGISVRGRAGEAVLCRVTDDGHVRDGFRHR